MCNVGFGSTSFGQKLLSLMLIDTVEGTDRLVIQKNSNGNKFTRTITHSDYVAQIFKDIVLEDITSDDVENKSDVVGATVTDALNTLDEVEFTGTPHSSNVTAVDGNWIEASNAITVTLDDTSDVGAEVMVTNGDSSTITINSVGLYIKYTSTVNTLQTINQGTTLHFQLLTDVGVNYWRIR